MYLTSADLHVYLWSSRCIVSIPTAVRELTKVLACIEKTGQISVNCDTTTSNKGCNEMSVGEMENEDPASR